MLKSVLQSGPYIRHAFTGYFLEKKCALCRVFVTNLSQNFKILTLRLRGSHTMLGDYFWGLLQLKTVLSCFNQTGQDLCLRTGVCRTKTLEISRKKVGVAIILSVVFKNHGDGVLIRNATLNLWKFPRNLCKWNQNWNLKPESHLAYGLWEIYSWTNQHEESLQ